MSEYDQLCELLAQQIGQTIVVIDKRGREKTGLLIDVWDNSVKVEHNGVPTNYPITGEYDFKKDIYE